MDTGTHSIKVIFGQERRLVVPLFQRSYVWQREQQWEPLWEDVRALAERLLQQKLPVRPHFLGALVLDLQPQPTGHLENRLIIDGQQRMITCQIILKAFADICSALDLDKYHKALLKLTHNDDPLSNDPDEVFKVWPTNVDQEQFRKVMHAGSPETLAKYALPSHSFIADAYNYFHGVILDWVKLEKGKHEERTESLYTVLREYVRMVVIDLEKEDDAQLIFETLNARGTPLLPSDLVKNFLLRRTALEGAEIEPIYERYWKPFDADVGYWRKELGPGHARRARIDIYLQHYLTLKKHDEVPVAHLYAAFREYASNGCDANGQVSDEQTTNCQVATAQSHLQALHKYAQIYKRFDTIDRSTRIGLFFRRLEQLDTTTAYPFLLELFTLYGFDDKTAQAAQVLVDIESLLVRRMVCQLPTRGYNRLFIDLLGQLEGPSEELASRVRNALLEGTAESTRWPNDREFREAWLNTPLYRVLRRERIRMLLESLERGLYTELTEKIEIRGGLTIEHLMPQTWQPYWPLPQEASDEDSEAHRDRIIHTLGNLTLLTKRLNPKVSNGPWSTKQPAILQHSALTLNRQCQNYPIWDEQTIVQRGESLFEIAKKIWPFPQS